MIIMIIIIDNTINNSNNKRFRLIILVTKTQPIKGIVVYYSAGEFITIGR